MAGELTEVQLNLVITAKNMADEALSGLRSTLESLTNTINRTFEEIDVSGQRAVTNLRDSFLTLRESFSQPLRINVEVSGADAAQRLESEFQGAVRAIDADFIQMGESVSRSFVSTEEAAASAARSMESAFQGAEHALVPIGETGVTVARRLESDFRSAGNVIDAEFTVVSETMTRDMEQSTSRISEMLSRLRNALRETFSTEGKDLFDIAKIQIAGQELQSLGQHMLGFFAESAKAAIDFDQEIHNVVASLAAMGDASMKPQQAFEALKQRALDLGMSGFFSANEIAQAMNTMAAQGITASQILGGAIDVVAKVAAANQQDLEHTANVVSDIIHQMGDELKHEFGDNFKAQMQGVGNAMTKALHNGRMSMEDFLSVMRYAGPQAASAGIQFKDLAGAIAELARHGIKGSQAGTTLRRMFTNLIPQTKAATEEMKNLGLITKDGANILLDASGKIKPLAEVQRILHDRISKLSPAMQEMAIKTIFGQYALSGMTAIIDEAPSKFSALIKSMSDAKAMSEALAEKQQGLGFKVQQLKAHFDTFMKEVGDALKPLLIGLIDVVNSLLIAWQSLPSGVQKAIVIFTAVGAAAATALGSFMLFITGLNFFKDAMNPVLEDLKLLSGSLALGGFEALGNAARGAVSGFRTLGSAISALMFGPYKLLINGFRSIPNVFRQIPIVFTGLLNTIKSFATGIVNVIKLIFTDGLLLLASKLGAGFRLLKDTILGIGPAFLNFIRSALTLENALMLLQKGLQLVRTGFTLLASPWGALVFLIITGVSYIISHWNQIVKWVQQNFGHTIPTNFRQFQQLCSQVWTQVQNVFTTVWNAIKQVVTAAWNYIRPTIMDGLKTVQEYWNQVWPEIQQLFAEVWAAIKVILGPSVAFLYVTISAALGFIRGAWTNGWNAIKDIFKFVWDLIVGLVRTGWSIVSGLFKVGLDLLTGHWRQAWNDLRNTFSNTWHSIIGMFGSLLNDAISFGRNFVMMIANGIEGAIGYVINAASHVAAVIKSYLGFHSPTETGPASDSDRWAPNFMVMFSQGLEDYQYLVENAVNHTAQIMHDALITPSISVANPIISAPPIEAGTFTPDFNRYERVAGHTSHLPRTTTYYDRVAGHTSHSVGRTNYYALVPGHTSHQPVNIHIHIEGRSAQTDQQLVRMIADHLGRKFRTHLTLANPR